MVDFRKIISPKSRMEIQERRERRMAFQAQDRAGMAASLIASSRALADSGQFHSSPDWSYDEWAIYRCIPALAKRLDPALELRADEIAKSEEKRDPLTWIEDGDDEKLLSSIKSIIANASFRRAYDGPETVKAAADALLDPRSQGCDIAVAMDTVIPGSFPKRTEADEREPLPGVQLIASYSSGYDQVIQYAEAEAELEQGFRVAESLRLGEELSEEDEAYAQRMRRVSISKLDFETLSIQAYDGTVLREREFTAEPEPAPAM